LKQQSNYSKPFNINLENIQDNLIPMPGAEEGMTDLVFKLA
jgi:hypothetical protein